VSGPQVLAVPAGSPYKTVKDLIDGLKANPGKLTFGHAGIGSQTHLAAENFVNAAGIDAVHVPYKGEGPALVDLAAGQIIFLTPNLSAAIGFVQQGRLRALAVTSRQRAPQVKDVPTVAETLPGFENLGWFGLMVPAGTSRTIIDRVHADTVKALAAADLRKRLDEIGMAPVGNTPDDFAKAIREETERWARVVKERKLQVQ
jgi:tripartite-type tricarboxylate transporter receptor subunit TctC